MAIKIKQMKKIFLLAAALFSINAFSQNVKIKGAFDQSSANRKLSLFRPINFTQYPTANVNEYIDINKGKYFVKLTVPEPEIMYLASYINDSLEFSQPLFLKNGYAIEIDYKTKTGKPRLMVTGKGASDNQPLVLSDYDNINDYAKDTVPDNVFAYIQQESKKNTQAIDNYIAKYKPSADFIKHRNYEIKYAPVKAYYSFAQQRKFYIKDAYKRNIEKWNAVFNQLLKDAPLINDDALNISSYRFFLKDYLQRTKEQLWNDASADIKGFVKKWYGDDFIKGEAEFNADVSNRLCQKIIEKYFTGKVKEYMYSCLIKEAVESSLVQNMASIYNDFSTAFPYSKYKKIYDKPVSIMLEKLKRPLTNKMIFIANSDSLNSWAEVVAMFKGKTVLLDMWGTWCGPCREEIEKNGPAIKSYFKNKEVDYLYIANYDEDNKEQWKSLIAYFNMEGSHILASKKLTTDIMEILKGEGYPTYAVIHKDGSFELSKAGYPMDRQKLIEQIEAALK
jgi:thiol-disulfide isomerase/thioredoxin